MRHLVTGRRLSRTAAHRKAMLRNLSQSLFEHGQVRTTLPKARELVRFVEPLITLARKNTLAARRLVISRLRDRLMADPNDSDRLMDDSVVQKLFKEIAPYYADRNGGYTRIIKTSEWRIGDAGDIAIVQLVGIAKVRQRPTRPAPESASAQ